MLSEKPALLLRPRLVALDTSLLSAVARDKLSMQAESRKRAVAFEDALGKLGCVILLCWHHIEELIAIRDDKEVANRLALLRSLPMLAWITPRQIDGGAGSVIDILAAETAAALKLPGAKCYAIRDLAAKELVRFGSGEQVLRPYEDVWPQLRAQVWERERKTREIVAISRSEFINLSKSKLKDWRKEQLRTPEDSERQLEALKVRLAADIKQRGDKRIESPIESASRFIEGVKSQASTIFSHEGGPADQILRSQDIDLGELDPECTLGDAFALGTFRHRLRVVSGIMSQPYSELKVRVREDQLPSCIIQGAINRYRQDAPERKGSDLADSYLACLAAYADVTYVDKRTAENLRRALPKSPECAALLGRVEKAGSYPIIVTQLRS